MIDVPDAQKLRDAFAARPQTADHDDDFDSERIWQAVNGEICSEERQAVVEEVMSNPAAAEAWRLAEEMRRAAGLEFSEDEERASSDSITGPRLWLVAAIVVVAAGLAALWRPWQSDEPVIYRSPSQATIESGIGTESRCSQQSCVLEWTDIVGAEGYLLRITSDALEPVLEVELESSEFSLDRAALQLEPGQTLLWQVEATTTDGERLTSQTFVLNLD